MGEENQTPVAPSPTGTPWLPPGATKYVVGVITLALSVFGALALLYPDVKAFTVAFVLAGAIGSVFGIVSPGLRKPTVVGLFLVCVSLTGCPRLIRTIDIAAPKVLNCFGSAYAKDVPALTVQAGDALAAAIDGRNMDPEPIIENLLSTGIAAMPCAIKAVLDSWAQAGPGAGSPLPHSARARQDLVIKTARAQAYLAARYTITSQ
jgi:hypothetical protein